MAFRFESFSGFPLRHAMSNRDTTLPSEGDIAYARDTIPEHITSNRTRFLHQEGFDLASLTLGRQVHGKTVSVVQDTDRGRGQPPLFDAIPASDGLVTRSATVTLGTIVADCVPILMYDPVQHALGLVHAGWRGTVEKIVNVAVTAMVDEFNCKPADLHAGVGSSIGPCCYEVGPEVLAAWEAAGAEDWESARVAREPRNHFNLWRANELLLLQAGLPGEHIEIAGICTRCAAEHYFSHRSAMAGERAPGRMIMVAQLT